MDIRAQGRLLAKYELVTPNSLRDGAIQKSISQMCQFRHDFPTSPNEPQILTQILVDTTTSGRHDCNVTLLYCQSALSECERTISVRLCASDPASVDTLLLEHCKEVIHFASHFGFA